MTDRTAKINFALKAIPNYNGDSNKLNVFIQAVNQVQALLGTLDPPLDDFDKAIAFLNIKSKITEKALDSIKDLEFQSWNDLKDHLKKSFRDQTSSTTMVMELLKIQNRNPYKLLEIVKEKFLSFKSRLGIEEDNINKKLIIIEFTEKLIVNNFISTIGDPYRNNLATRNPRSINEIEELLQNDFQYLRQNINSNYKPIVKQLPNIPPQRFPNTNFPSGPINLQNKNTSNQRFAPKQQIRNAQDMKPTPMSIQTRQFWQQKPNNQPNTYHQNYKYQNNNKQPGFTSEELNNTEIQENDDPEINYEVNNEISEEIDEIEYGSSFLDQNSLDVQEKS